MYMTVILILSLKSFEISDALCVKSVIENHCFREITSEEETLQIHLLKVHVWNRNFDTNFTLTTTVIVIITVILQSLDTILDTQVFGWLPTCTSDKAFLWHSIHLLTENVKKTPTHLQPLESILQLSNKSLSRLSDSVVYTKSKGKRCFYGEKNTGLVIYL